MVGKLHNSVNSLEMPLPALGLSLAPISCPCLAVNPHIIINNHWSLLVALQLRPNWAQRACWAFPLGAEEALKLAYPTQAKMQGNATCKYNKYEVANQKAVPTVTRAIAVSAGVYGAQSYTLNRTHQRARHFITELCARSLVRTFDGGSGVSFD